MVYLLSVFGFDMGEPAGVNIRYTFYICNNFNSFDSWPSGKISGFGRPLTEKGSLKKPVFMEWILNETENKSVDLFYSFFSRS